MPTAANTPTTPTATPAKLSAAQARALADADVDAAQKKAAYEQARAHRDELFARYAERIPLSSDPKKAEKGTHEAEAGGYHVAWTPVAGRETFSLKTYRELGHRITNAMREAMAIGDSFQRWTIKRVKGPHRPGSVEPTAPAS